MPTNYEKIKNMPDLIREELRSILTKANSFKHHNYTENNNQWESFDAQKVYDEIMLLFENRLKFWKQFESETK